MVASQLEARIRCSRPITSNRPTLVNDVHCRIYSCGDGSALMISAGGFRVALRDLLAWLAHWFYGFPPVVRLYSSIIDASCTWAVV